MAVVESIASWQIEPKRRTWSRIDSVAGRVSMDYLCVDLGQTQAQLGDSVTLIGEEDEGSITTEDLANWAETLPYEILTGLVSRLPRFYKKASPLPLPARQSFVGGEG